MTESILDGKRILAVDDEPDVLEVLEEELLEACPTCIFETATTYEKGREMLMSGDYDVVVLDIMGVRGWDLLEIAVRRDFKVVMLTAYNPSLEGFNKAQNEGARGYVPKEKLDEIVSYLEDLFKYDFRSGWDRLFDKFHSVIS